MHLWQGLFEDGFQIVVLQLEYVIREGLQPDSPYDQDIIVASPLSCMTCTQGMLLSRNVRCHLLSPRHWICKNQLRPLYLLWMAYALVPNCDHTDFHKQETRFQILFLCNLSKCYHLAECFTHVFLFYCFACRGKQQGMQESSGLVEQLHEE